MLCPKCKIEASNHNDEQGNWVAKCRNPQCPDYGKTIKVIIARDVEADQPQPFEDNIGESLT